MHDFHESCLDIFSADGAYGDDIGFNSKKIGADEAASPHFVLQEH